MFGGTAAEEKHGALMVQRLKSLVIAGYVPDLTDDPSIDSIDFKHPRDDVRPVSLWSDGQVVDLYPTQVKDEDGPIIIQQDDENQFRLLIKNSPKLNFMERVGRTTLGEAAQNVQAWAILIAVWWGMSWFIGRGWHAIKEAFGH